MLSMLAQYWWALAVRGVFAILFGIAAIVWPGLTLLTLVLLFGAYALVDGIFSVVNGIRSYGEHERWWAILIEGLLGIAIGIITFVWPDITALTLLYLIAAWALLTGVLEIVAAIQLRKVITGEWIMILNGVISIVFGLLLIVFPGEGALGLTWLIGIYAIIFGVLFIILSLRLRGMKGQMEQTPVSRSFE